MTDDWVREFQIGRSKSRHGLLIGALCLGLGVATLAFFRESVADSQWIGTVLVALGAGVAIHAWRLGRTPGAHLRLTEEGVYFREWGATVPWDAIADVYQSGSRLQPFVTLRVADPERLLAAVPQEQARGLRRNRLWKPPELRIPYSAVEASRDQVIEAIEAGRRRWQAPVA